MFNLNLITNTNLMCRANQGQSSIESYNLHTFAMGTIGDIPRLSVRTKCALGLYSSCTHSCKYQSQTVLG